MSSGLWDCAPDFTEQNILLLYTPKNDKRGEKEINILCGGGENE